MHKKLIAMILVIFILLSCSACSSNETKTPDQEILQMSSEILEDWGVEEGRTFSVVLDKEGIYNIDINGDLLLVKFGENNQTKSEKFNVEDCDEKTERVVVSSKNIVEKYIKESSILDSKEELIDYIRKVPVKLADFSDDTVAEYSVEDDDTIYINKLYKMYVSEWMIVHELIHALGEKTNGGYENLRYPYNLFNEVLTDIITASLNPDVSADKISGYAPYHQWGYLYLACFQEEGLKAYFYGYKNILEQIPEEELDIFVESMEQLEDYENAIVIICNCINKWGEQQVA